MRASDVDNYLREIRVADHSLMLDRIRPSDFLTERKVAEPEKPVESTLLGSWLRLEYLGRVAKSARFDRGGLIDLYGAEERTKILAMVEHLLIAPDSYSSEIFSVVAAMDRLIAGDPEEKPAPKEQPCPKLRRAALLAWMMIEFEAVQIQIESATSRHQWTMHRFIGELEENFTGLIRDDAPGVAIPSQLNSRGDAAVKAYLELSEDLGSAAESYLEVRSVERTSLESVLSQFRSECRNACDPKTDDSVRMFLKLMAGLSWTKENRVTLLEEILRPDKLKFTPKKSKSLFEQILEMDPTILERYHDFNL